MRPNKNAWCEFHQAYGHHIRNCLALAHQLDELVKNSFLKDYLQEPQEDQALVAIGGSGAGGRRDQALLFAREDESSTRRGVWSSEEETEKLLRVDHIREIQYPEWLANMVLVKKASGKWRMCVDFTDLNKACPKDSYPLPSIDGLVDNASGCRLLSFLDVFSGYNQIMMHPRDDCKRAFMTKLSRYCYKVLPFGLKNAGAMYQRLMDRVLAPMLGRNVQAYVDDMVVPSQQREQHVADLEELFTIIAKYRLKLNL